MSLKVFHIVFVVASVIVTFGFAVWGVAAYAADGEVSNLLLGLVSLGCGAALVVYGYKFFGKLRKMGSWL